MPRRVFVTLITAVALSGCTWLLGDASCSWQGYTIAEHTMWWQDDHSSEDIASIMLDHGWRTVLENETYETFEPAEPSPTPAGGMMYGPNLPQGQRARYAIALNESATVLAIDSTSSGARGSTLTVVTFVVPGSVVGNGTESQTLFAGRIDATLGALDAAFGAPEHSTWVGGKQHCGAV